ncbi:adenylate kinase domain protein [Ostertagia ostertagi]
MGQVRMIEEVAPLDLVVELRVPKKVLIDRLSKQLVHHGSGRTYNLDFNPPKVEGKDDITGEPLFKREDDAAEVVGRRLEVHEKTESKVVDYYRNHGICVTMSGDKSPVVFQAVSEMMNDLLKKRAFG